MRPCGHSACLVSLLQDVVCALIGKSQSDDDDDDDRRIHGRPVSVDGGRSTLSDESIGAMVGALATLAVLLFVLAGLLAWRRQRQFGVHRVLKCLDGPLQVATATSRPPASPRRCTAGHFNASSNGLAVTAKVLRSRAVNYTNYTFETRYRESAL